MRTSRPLLLDLSADDFQRGYVGERPPSLVAPPPPPKPSRVGERIAQVLMFVGLGVLATIAYRGAHPMHHSSMVVEISRPLPAMQPAQVVPVIAH